MPHNVECRCKPCWDTWGRFFRPDDKASRTFFTYGLGYFMTPITIDEAWEPEDPDSVPAST